MITLIVQGMGFGFAAGTTPGPLQTFLISTTLSRGWQRGMVIVLSPLVTDAPIILLMTFLLHQLPVGLVRAIQVAGGLLVLYLAWGTYQSLRAGVKIGDGAEDVESSRRILLQAAGLNYLSPGPYIFWGSVTGPVLVQALEQSPGNALAFLVSFYLSFMSLMALLVFSFDRLRRLDPRVTQAVLWFTVVVLVVLGFVLMGNGLFG